MLRLTRLWLPALLVCHTVGSSSGCAVLPAASPQAASGDRWPAAQRLTIWTAAWCGQCRRFWQDFRDDERFRGVITSQFQVHALDIDHHRRAAEDTGIRSVPIFQWQRSRVVGYQGKTWLLDRLGLPSADPEPPTPAPSSEGQGPTIPDASTSFVGLNVPAQRPQNAPHADEDVTSDSSVKTGVDSAGAVSSSASLRSSWALPALDRLLGISGPIVLSAIELLGLISGTAATGGVGAVALGALWQRWRRSRRRRRAAPRREPGVDIPVATEGGERIVAQAPFPRRLDEARELLALRQSEGRVGVLDALRGMFLDDELQKLTESSDQRNASIALRLRDAIDTRVDEVAPLSTTVD